MFDLLDGGFEHGDEGGEDGAKLVDAFVDLIDEAMGAGGDQLAIPFQKFLADGFLLVRREGAPAIAGEEFAENKGGEVPGVFGRVGLRE